MIAMLESAVVVKCRSGPNAGKPGRCPKPRADQKPSPKTSPKKPAAAKKPSAKKPKTKTVKASATKTKSQAPFKPRTVPAVASILATITGAKTPSVGLLRSLSPLSDEAHEENRAYAKSTYGAAYKAMPEPQRKAVRYYSNDIGFSEINEALRAGKTHDRVAELDKAMLPLKEDVALYRGVSEKGLKSILASIGAKSPADLVGRPLEDKAYGSTTENPAIAASFGTGAIFQIRAFKGQKAFMMNANDPHHPEEDEVLLPRGSKLKIVEAVKVGGTWKITAEVA